MGKASHIRHGSALHELVLDLDLDHVAVAPRGLLVVAGSPTIGLSPLSRKSGEPRSSQDHNGNGQTFGEVMAPGNRETPSSSTAPRLMMSELPHVGWVVDPRGLR